MNIHNLSWSDWQGEICDHLVELLEVSRGDAQGIAEAHSFEIMQEWTRGSSPLTTAKRLSEL